MARLVPYRNLSWFYCFDHAVAARKKVMQVSKTVEKTVQKSATAGGDVRTAAEVRVQDALKQALQKKSPGKSAADLGSAGRYSPPSVAWKPKSSASTHSRDHLSQMMLPFAAVQRQLQLQNQSQAAAAAGRSVTATNTRNPFCENLYRSLLNDDQCSSAASSGQPNTTSNVSAPAQPPVIDCDSSSSDIIIVSSDDEVPRN